MSNYIKRDNSRTNKELQSYNGPAGAAKTACNKTRLFPEEPRINAVIVSPEISSGLKSLFDRTQPIRSNIHFVD